MLLAVSIPFAHAGHVLIQLPIYLGPVVAIVAWLKIAGWREKRAGKRRASSTPGSRNGGRTGGRA